MTQEDQSRSLKAVVTKLSEELNDDKELLKQALADLNALERQNLQHAFDARKEYARQVGETDRLREVAVKEYGMQTLKWVFLMNAGAAALLLGYIAHSGNSNASSPESIRGLLHAAIPFGVGCVLVVVAGLSAWANFNYASLALPSVEAMYNFFNLNQAVTEWPMPKGLSEGVDRKLFQTKMRSKLQWTMRIAVCSGVASILCFAIGIVMVVLV